MGRNAKLSVGFILLPHFTLTAFSTIIDMLRLSADEGDRSRQVRCRWTVLGSSQRPVTASCGVSITPWRTYGDPGEFDYVVVVGGLLHRGPTADEATLDFLRAADARNVHIAGVCTGSFTLAKAGLLQGRKCCVNWFHYGDLMEHVDGVVPVADQIFVQDGRYITCAGGLAALDLGAWMVERHLGGAPMEKSLRILGADAPRLATAAQPLSPTRGPIADEKVRRAVLLIEQNLGYPPRIDQLAQAVGLSRRQLERRFQMVTGKSIQRFSRDLRLIHGLWLLATSEKPITQIAVETGFCDTSHFNRAAHAGFGRSPSALRRLGSDALRDGGGDWSALLTDVEPSLGRVVEEQLSAFAGELRMTQKGRSGPRQRAVRPSRADACMA